MEKKMTRVEKFNVIKAVINNVEDFDDSKMTKDEINEFLDHQIELASKKSVRKADEEKLAENEVIRTELLSTLTDVGDTVTNIIKKSEVLATMPALTSQRVTSILGSLVSEDKVANYKEKGKSYYKLA